MTWLYPYLYMLSRPGSIFPTLPLEALGMLHTNESLTAALQIQSTV